MRLRSEKIMLEKQTLVDILKHRSINGEDIVACEQVLDNPVFLKAKLRGSNIDASVLVSVCKR